MHYHPVLAENQSNFNAGFHVIKKAGEEGTQTYVLFPVLSDGSTNPKNYNKDALVDGKEHDDDIQKFVSPDIYSSSCGDQTRKQGDKVENKDKGKSHVVTITGFRDLNEEFKECINNNSNGVNAAGSLVSATELNFINSTNDFSAAGFHVTEKAGEEGTQTYVLFPMLSDGSTNPKNYNKDALNNNKDALVNGKEHDDDIQKSVSPDIHSSSSGAQTRKQGDKTKNKDKGKSYVVTIIGFKDLNAEFKECNNNNSNGVNAANSLVSTAGHNFMNNTNDFSAAGPSNAGMPNVEDLTYSNHVDDVSVEADINNLESIILAVLF
nr:hypothetical protein [Tanacetum cinerariifolium]